MLSKSNVLTGKKGLLEIVHQLSRSERPGPSPSFSYLHVCKTLLVVGEKDLLGRLTLSKKLAVGEGVVRTILRRLSRATLVESSRRGYGLSKKGRRIYRLLTARIPKLISIDARQFSLDKYNATVFVKDAAHLVKMGVEQRDAAVSTGATGAVTLVFRDGKYVMPMGAETWELKPQDPVSRGLRRHFNPSDNDVVILVSAGDSLRAEYGALAAALTLTG